MFGFLAKLWPNIRPYLGLLKYLIVSLDRSPILLRVISWLHKVANLLQVDTFHSEQFQPTHIWNPWSNETDANLEDSACTVHAIWSYNERWDFPRAGSSLFLPRFSGLTFLRFLGPFFIFFEFFTSDVLLIFYFVCVDFSHHLRTLSSSIHKYFTGYLIF